MHPCLPKSAILPYPFLITALFINSFVALGLYYFGTSRKAYRRAHSDALDDYLLDEDSLSTNDDNDLHRQPKSSSFNIDATSPLTSPHSNNSNQTDLCDFRFQCATGTRGRFILDVIKNFIIIYHIAFMILIFVLDIFRMREYIPPSASTWEKYQCYTSIVVTSPNFKNVSSVFLCLAPLVVLNRFQVSFLRNAAFLVSSILMFSIVPIYFSHFLAMIFIYIWLTFGICFVLIPCFICVRARYLSFSQRNEKGGRSSFGSLFLAAFPMTFASYCVVFFVELAIRYYLSGKYLKSIEVVLTRRDFVGYFRPVFVNKEWENIARFVAWLL